MTQLAEDLEATDRTALSADTRLRLAMDAGRMAVWDVDMVTGAIICSPELNRLLGFPANAAPTIDEIREGYRPGDGNRLRQAGYAALARGEHYFEVEFCYERRNDGALRWLQLRAEILAEDGRMASVLGVLLDVTDRREAEERLRLLAREVDHRANNLLAVAQAAVKLSRGDSVKELKEAIEGRIAALAHAHNLLSGSRWVGADLRRLIEEELKPYLTGESRKVSVSGPEVALGVEAAQSVAMAIHELTTNAVKYGALSFRTGRLKVTWERDENGDLALRWDESGARCVTPPTRRGFGMGMVERTAAQMKGKVVYCWKPDGMTCDLLVPAARLAQV